MYYIWQKLPRLITCGKNYPDILHVAKITIDLLQVEKLPRLITCGNLYLVWLVDIAFSVDRDQEIQCEVMDRLLQTILREVSRISIIHYSMTVMFTSIHTGNSFKWLTIKIKYWRTCSSSLYLYTEWLFFHSQQDECDLDMTGAPLAACICQILASQLSSNLFPKEQDEE